MPPFGMYMILAPRSAVPEAPVHPSPIAKRSHTSQNDVGATRRPFVFSNIPVLLLHF